MIRRTLPLLLLLAFLLSAAPVRAGQVYEIGFPCYDAMCTFPEFEAVLTEAYARIGAAVRFKRLPLMRDLRDANAGTIDGSLTRNPDAISQFPNLIPVYPALGEYTLAVFTLDPALADAPLEELGAYRIGYLRGDVTAQRLVDNAHIKTDTFLTVPGMLKMLKSDHLDAAILPRTIARMAAPALDLPALHVSRPLSKTLFHHSLNKKHSDIIPKLGEALREVYRDGTAKRILGGYLTYTPQ